MTDEDSRVEDRPSAAMPQTQRTLGRLENEDSVSINKPSPIRKGARQVPPAAVGLRAAPKPTGPSANAVEVHTGVRKKLRESRDEHRQKVWDKLDAARKKADEKRPRLDKFSPRRGS
jgi:hypothetical protein